MAWRVAFTSADGVYVNQHFGHARYFIIRDIEPDGTSSFLERREITPVCGSGDHGAAVLDDVVETLRDCVAVLTAKIGPAPRKRLELAGITVFEEPAVIEEAVMKLAAYYRRQTKSKQETR
ncbi:MAG: dinitrogenase iron-molybdenum cofactor biosynthesis protein [Treponema sp.]|jgi:predicted Fe-Mo cluster-binding NifX family protein|nr:dinitrogenase iron-molybdenum cofactor biosynthesis protein [Treponema sp.]